jgi:hypothetical protein
MKNHLKILFSIMAAAICTVSFAADKPSCQKTGKNCPMNNGKACNCGKSWIVSEPGASLLIADDASHREAATEDIRSAGARF